MVLKEGVWKIACEIDLLPWHYVGSSTQFSVENRTVHKIGTWFVL